MVEKLNKTFQPSQGAQDMDTPVWTLGRNYPRLAAPLRACSPSAHANDSVPVSDESVGPHTHAHTRITSGD